MLIDGMIDYFKLNTDYVFLFSKRDSLDFFKGIYQLICN